MSVMVHHDEAALRRLMDFYHEVLRALEHAKIPYLLGGSYATQCYTGIQPHTKDMDVFIRHQHLKPLREAMTAACFQCEVTFPHWLAKIYRRDDEFVDVIFSSGNGCCAVDDQWFQHARSGSVAGHSVWLCPPEEMIWSKAFIMERERYDGADVAHFLRILAKTLDWRRLLQRFGSHGRVLLSHLILFGYVYPHLRSTIPQWVLDELMTQVQREQHDEVPAAAELVCYGTFLSRQQYLPDIQSWGHSDARVVLATMSTADVARWTEAIELPEPKVP